MRKLDLHSPFSCCPVQCESVWKKVTITCVYDLYKPNIVSPKRTTHHKEIMDIAGRVHCIIPKVSKISINFLNWACFASVSTPLRSSHWMCSVRKGVLRNFARTPFSIEHLWWMLLSSENWTLCHRYLVIFIHIYICPYKSFLTYMSYQFTYTYTYTVCTGKWQLILKDLLSVFSHSIKIIFGNDKKINGKYKVNRQFCAF